MAKIFKKYEFESQELAQKRINALPKETVDNETYFVHSHEVIELGFLMLEKPVFDGEVLISDAVLSDKYSVDVLWESDELPLEDDGDIDYPYGWVSKEIDVDNNGKHTF